MSDLRDRNELPCARLKDVRRLEIIYSRVRPGEGTCFVEYIGGRVEVLEVDRYLIGRLLEHLEDRNPDG